MTLLIDVSHYDTRDPWGPPSAPIYAAHQEHEDQVQVCCDDCGGEGGWDVLTHFDRNGNECGYHETCPSCEGRGGGWIDAEPITLEDLEEMI